MSDRNQSYKSNNMNNTNNGWREEFNGLMSSMITPIKLRNMTAIGMQKQIESFIEKEIASQRQSAQIEMLEVILKLKN